MRVSANELFEFIVSMVLASSVFLGVLAVALRFSVRPLLAEWAKLRGQSGNAALEGRVAELEQEVRELKLGPNQLQLPVELRSGAHSRT